MTYDTLDISKTLEKGVPNMLVPYDVDCPGCSSVQKETESSRECRLRCFFEESISEEYLRFIGARVLQCNDTTGASQLGDPELAVCREEGARTHFFRCVPVSNSSGDSWETLGCDETKCASHEELNPVCVDRFNCPALNNTFKCGCTDTRHGDFCEPKTEMIIVFAAGALLTIVVCVLFFKRKKFR